MNIAVFWRASRPPMDLLTQWQRSRVAFLDKKIDNAREYERKWDTEIPEIEEWEKEITDLKSLIPSRGTAPGAYATIVELLGVWVPRSRRRDTPGRFFLLHCEINDRSVTISRPTEDRVEIKVQVTRNLHHNTTCETTRSFLLLPDDTVHVANDHSLSPEIIEGVVGLLTRLGADKNTFLDDNRRTMGRCCWCNRRLSRTDSIAAGAGSVCNERLKK